MCDTSMPDYRTFVSETGQTDGWIAAINTAGRLLTVGQLHRATQGDIEQMNDSINKSLDRLIDAAGGDVKLALFGAVAAYSQAASMIQRLMK